MEEAYVPPRLYDNSDLDLVGHREMQAYHMLKDQTMKSWDSALYANIPITRSYVDEAYLVQCHILKHGPNDYLIFLFPGYANEITLPNPEFHLYNCRELTISFQAELPREVPRRSPLEGIWENSSGGWIHLELQAGNEQHTLEDHVVQSRERQQSVGAQLANFNTMMQQQQADWQAFHCYQGFDPHLEP
uniref:Uncharacterized protein n=2 Tax=Oryza sativa subsp. japonica TaxID=39947 RepID=Q2R630_ORYSJ|nr:hypothetical protein LOC_Os11g22470 [Oryza sativa Japonica Group]ABA93166.1 hypothetical protein LOC_Os11g22470 [Oryza sativa Japonica Group]